MTIFCSKCCWLKYIKDKMSNKPQKPLTKSSRVTEVWTSSSEDRLKVLEKQIIDIEKRLNVIVRHINAKKQSTGTNMGYSITTKS